MAINYATILVWEILKYFMDKKCVIKIVKENVWNFVKDTVRENVAKIWYNLKHIKFIKILLQISKPDNSKI